MADFGIGETLTALEAIGSAVGTGAAAVGSAAAGTAGAIGSTLAGIAPAVAGGAEAIGIPGAIATPLGGIVGGGVEGALTGAGTGALEGAVTGGNIGKDALKGAEFGAATGGVLGGFNPGVTPTAPGGTAPIDASATTLPPVAPAVGGGAAAPVPIAPPSIAPPPVDLGGGAGSDFLGGGAATGGAATAQLPGDVNTGAAGGGTASVANLPAVPGVQPISVGPSPTLTPAGTGQFAQPTDLTQPSAPSLTPHGATNPLSGAGDYLKQHPTLALAGLGLGADAISGMRKPPYEGVLQSQAHNLATQSGEMESYIHSGTLPPGLQAQVTGATTAADAAIRSQAAARGASGSSAEYQDLANANERAAVDGGQLAIQLFQQGINEAQMSDQLYAELMQTEMAQDSALSGAVGNFSAALAMSGSPLRAAA